MDNNFGKIYIGAMSGTSLDGLDLVAVIFKKNTSTKENYQPIKILATGKYDFPEQIKSDFKKLINDHNSPYKLLLETDIIFGKWLAEQINHFIHKNKIIKNNITAVGIHGQTILHQINHNTVSFSCQIGNAAVIAEHTNLNIINDFRTRDIAAGGNGAPLVCGFHQWLASHYKQPLLLLNIGGIANITMVDYHQKHTIGYDIGPGNCLLDALIYRHNKKYFDENGAFASSGKVNLELLKLLLADSYFKQPAPKSTGVEYFNLSWLDNYISQLQQKQSTNSPIKNQDIQATLVELNACILAENLNNLSTNYLNINPQDTAVFVFGGGVHNNFMQKTLANKTTFKLVSSTELDINPDYMEAIAFAWLARQNHNQKYGNIPSVTGAKKDVILGVSHLI